MVGNLALLAAPQTTQTYYSFVTTTVVEVYSMRTGSPQWLFLILLNVVAVEGRSNGIWG